MTRPPIALGVLATHARSVPAAERTRFATAMRAELGPDALLVETCHRVEAYVPSDRELDRLARGWLPPGGAALQGEAAVRHAIRVAIGRDSVVLGEDQVLHQVRQAVAAAQAAGQRLDPALARLFQVALRAGRLARSWRSGPERSLAGLALQACTARTGSLAGRSVLVVGAGSMGQLAVAAARRAGATVAVTSRTAARAGELARSDGVEVVPFDPGAAIGAHAAIIIALAGVWPLAVDTRAALVAGTSTVVDLSVPSALDAGLRTALGDRLVVADDLALGGPGEEPADARLGRRLDALLETATAEVLAWLDAREAHHAAAALADQADRVRAAELDALFRRLPDLDGETRAAIDGMTRHLADRLLQTPLERLGRDEDGRTAAAVREVFAL